MSDIENILKIILLIILILGLAFTFLYFVLLLRGISGLLSNIKKSSDKVLEVINNPNDLKDHLEEFALSTVDKVIDQQNIKIRRFFSNNVLSNLIKLLRKQ